MIAVCISRSTQNIEPFFSIGVCWEYTVFGAYDCMGNSKDVDLQSINQSIRKQRNFIQLLRITPKPAARPIVCYYQLTVHPVNSELQPDIR
jgi:hypothetical protein